MNTDEIIEVSITDLAFGGDGVARHEECVIFIPYAALGDILKVRITSLRKNFARGEIVEILKPGPGRCAPQCRHYGKCVGCQYQHLDYQEELSAKTKQLSDLLHRIARLDSLPSPQPEIVFGSPKIYGYRNKLRLEAASASLPGVEGKHVIYGYYLADNRTLLRLTSGCPLAADAINAEIPKALRSEWGRANANRKPGKPDRRGNTLGGPGALTLRLASDENEPRYFFGFAPKRAVWLHESLGKHSYSVPLGAFWQINPPVAAALVSQTDKWISEYQGLESLIDAYAGVGTFSCAMTLPFKERLLIESDAEATKAAQLNLQQQGQGAQIIAGTTEKILPKSIRNYDARHLCVILDPPRSGCQNEVLEAILKAHPAVVVYVSCNPSTLARDLQKLCSKEHSRPYTLRHYALFDMFPRTAHFETLAILS